MRVLKVVLADDEDIIREGIFHSIQWGEMGFEVVGQADDGEQAIELVEKTMPDVIITDIRMPFINGLEFIERIKDIYKDNYKNIHIIILTGHDEFQYAQKAIKLGVYDYVLKPLEPKYLMELLLKIKSNYMNRAEKESENTTLMKTQLIRDIIYERIKDMELMNKLDKISVEFNNSFSIIIMHIDNCRGLEVPQGCNEKLLERKIYDLIGNMQQKNTEILTFFEKSVYEYVICVNHKHKRVLETKIIEISNGIREEIKNSLGYTTSIAIGRIVENIGLIPNSYKQACEALMHKFILGTNQNIYFDRIEVAKKGQLKELNYSDSELIYALKLADKGLIKEKLHELLKGIQNSRSNSQIYMYAITGNVYIQALKVLKESFVSENQAIDESLLIYNQIISSDTIEKTISKLLSLLLKIADHININRQGKFDQVVEKAKTYISNNYSDHDCSLEVVARFVNVSPSYFSAIFKQQVGENFIDYLTHVRIEKAKELLSLSAFKSYEISYMVGYNNPTYFSTAFKKYVGVSPTEYRAS